VTPGKIPIIANAASSVLVAAVLVAYILDVMPGIWGFAGRLGRCWPLTQVILIRDQIVTKVGGHVLGNPLNSIVAGTGCYVWMPKSGVPCPVLLGIQGAPGAAMRHEVTPRHLDGS
jgi:hypothetical protein